MNLVVLELCNLWKSRMKICFLYWLIDSLEIEEIRPLGQKEKEKKEHHFRVSDDHSRGHVLHYAVKQVKTLVVIGLGGDELLEHAEETRLEK